MNIYAIDLFSIRNCYNYVIVIYNTSITNLSTAFSIEYGLIGDNREIAFGNLINTIVAVKDRYNLCLTSSGIISEKFSFSTYCRSSVFYRGKLS